MKVPSQKLSDIGHRTSDIGRFLLFTTFYFLLTTHYLYAQHNEDADTYFNVGTEKYLKGDYLGAVENLEKALSIDKANIKLKEYLLKVLLEAGKDYNITRDFKNSFYYLEKAKELYPDNPKVIELYNITKDIIVKSEQKNIPEITLPDIKELKPLKLPKSIKTEPASIPKTHTVEQAIVAVAPTSTSPISNIFAIPYKTIILPVAIFLSLLFIFYIYFTTIQRDIRKEKEELKKMRQELEETEIKKIAEAKIQEIVREKEQNFNMQLSNKKKFEEQRVKSELEDFKRREENKLKSEIEILRNGEKRHLEESLKRIKEKELKILGEIPQKIKTEEDRLKSLIEKRKELEEKILRECEEKKTLEEEKTAREITSKRIDEEEKLKLIINLRLSEEKNLLMNKEKPKETYVRVNDLVQQGPSLIQQQQRIQKLLREQSLIKEFGELEPTRERFKVTARALYEMNKDSALVLFKEFVKSQEKSAKQNIIPVLSEIATPETLNLLFEFVNETDYDVKKIFLYSLKNIKEKFEAKKLMLDKYYQNKVYEILNKEKISGEWII